MIYDRKWPVERYMMSMIELVANLPDSTRWQIVLAGTLFAIAALACLLLRGKMALVALLVLAIAAATCIIMWGLSFS